MDNQIRLIDNTNNYYKSIITIIVFTITYFVSISYNLYFYPLVKNAKSVIEFSQKNNNQFINYSYLGYFQLILGFITFLIFIKWLKRAYTNLDKSCMSVFLPESMIFWSFLIPFVNIILPYTIISKVWNKTQEVAQQNETKEQNIKSEIWLIFGWLFFLISGVINILLIFIDLNSNKMSEFINYFEFNIYSNIASILYLIMASVIIFKIHEFEIKMYESIKESKGIVLKVD